MKLKSRIAATLGVLASVAAAPVAAPAMAQGGASDNVRQDDKKSVPTAPAPAPQVQFAVRGKDRARVASDGLYAPGFGPPAIAYKMAARSGWGTTKRATKVRTHKTRG